MVNPIPFVVLFVAITQYYLFPHLSRSWTLLGRRRDWAASEELLHKLTPSCSTRHRDVLRGCVDMKLHSRTIYATCLGRGSSSQHRRWLSPYSTIRTDPAELGDDQLMAWDLDTDTVRLIELSSYAVTDRTFHGLDILEVSPSLLTIYIINHHFNHSTINKFMHRPHTSSATFIKSFSNPAVVPNPHSIFAIHGGDSTSSFYVTSDHMHCDGWKRSMETYFRLSTSSLSYYSDSAGWKVITSSLQGAGSITGPKTANSKRLYVAGITGGVILVYDQAVIAGDLSSSEAQAAEGDLILKQSISLDFIPSGLTLDLPYGTELWISGFPEPLGLLEYLGEGILGPAGHAKTAAIKGGVASLVATLNSKQLGSGFFGGSQENDESGKGEANGGYTSNPTVEEVLVDEHGTLVNGSYSLIVDRLSDRADRMLYVSGFDGNGILRCNEPLI